jgi:hypothetical protein
LGVGVGVGVGVCVCVCLHARTCLPFVFRFDA